MNRTTLQSTARGFSLPEVALSLGIAATALITLISLLPVGLDTLRESSNKQAEARIVQSIMDRYQTGTWLEQTSGGIRDSLLKDRFLFFDQTGSELEDDSDFACNYAVKVTVGGAPTLRGDAHSNQYLRQVGVRICPSAGDYQKSLADGSGKYKERSVWIALLEQTGPIPGISSTSLSSY